MACKVALVTGGAQGIGRGIVRRLLQEAVPPLWSVVVVDNNPSGVEDFQGYLVRHQLPTSRVHCHLGDVGVQQTSKDVVACVADRYGRLDLLVNNAGGGGLGVPLSDVSEDMWHAVLNSNLSSAFFFSQAAAPLLEKSRGSIVNISSTRAVMSEPDSFPYSAAKGGVESLTHALAASLAGKVNVNCLRLGWIDVSSSEYGPSRTQARLSEQDLLQHFSGRVGSADDVGSAVLFLVNAPFVCGECITLDGRMTRKMIYHDEDV